MHGWIRLTVGLSPWEHYFAINKKINKPAYLFIFPSLLSPLISLLLQGALFLPLALQRECLQRQHLQEAALGKTKIKGGCSMGKKKVGENYVNHF